MVCTHYTFELASQWVKIGLCQPWTKWGRTDIRLGHNPLMIWQRAYLTSMMRDAHTIQTGQVTAFLGSSSRYHSTIIAEQTKTALAH
ncbi:hypothetical protein N9089_01095 [Crocinitomicaceae bacterium]|nr:hypothetical protein [Crocinitomicaceae bacterium]